MHHTFRVVTVKKQLKSVYIYGSECKIKTGVQLFWSTLYTNLASMQNNNKYKTSPITAATLVRTSHQPASQPLLLAAAPDKEQCSGPANGRR